MTQQTPLMRQYTSIKKDYPDCVLFFRMGDFYEMFFDDAKIAAKALNVALTSRSKDRYEPMCGIPYHALSTYLARMVNAGHKVAICEQVEDPKQAKGLVKREVVRIVTPGTLTEDYLLDEKEANYLASVCEDNGRLGLGYMDLSTGFFAAREFKGGKAEQQLLDELARLRPREVVLPQGGVNGALRAGLESEGYNLEELDPFAYTDEEAERLLNEAFNTATLEGFGLSGHTAAISSAGGAMAYIKQNSPSALQAVTGIRYLRPGGTMEIDGASIRNLELVANLADGGRDGTLMEVLDDTKTAMGARLMREYLLQPLTEKEAILERQSLVTTFFADLPLREDTRAILADIGDMERCAGRIAGKSFNPRDFSGLAASVEKLPHLRARLADADGDTLQELMNDWDDLDELSQLLQNAVSPDHPATFKDTGFIKDGYNAELDEIRGFCNNVTGTIKAMEEREREATGLSSLKFGYNKIYGYYIEVSKKQAGTVPEGYIRKQSLVNSERYVSPELKELEEKLAGADEKQKELETRLVEELRTETLTYLERIRAAALRVARLDVAVALAEVANLNDYCRPEITDHTELDLRDSRHPVIERLMVEETFVPNDLAMDEEGDRMFIITGPNMAGKSTYLRQAALAVLMAQAGGYVAARSARIGIADRIFTRVGAQDRLQKGLSTFMVEMVETANILNNATEKSFVILDEIGRGTSTFDGVSIAWAVAEFLAALKTRTLFATHYHELTDLSATRSGVANFNVTAREYKDRLVFMRRIEEGPADKSYGIQVGRLAGLPQDVLKTARRVLADLEKMEFGADGKPALKASQPDDHEDQYSLFDARHHPVVDSLKEADINNMTPLEALNFLHRLKDDL